MSDARPVSSPKVKLAAEKSARRHSIPTMQPGEQPKKLSSSGKKKSFSSKELAVANRRKYYKCEVTRKHVFEVCKELVRINISDVQNNSYLDDSYECATGLD